MYELLLCSTEYESCLVLYCTGTWMTLYSTVATDQVHYGECELNKSKGYSILHVVLYTPGVSRTKLIFMPPRATKQVITVCT